MLDWSSRRSPTHNYFAHAHIYILLYTALNCEGLGSEASVYVLCLNFRFVKEHYNSLEQLFHADPLLLYYFIFLTRPGDYVNLFQKIPTHLSLECLLSLTFELRRFLVDDVSFIIMFGIIIKLITNTNTLGKTVGRLADDY